MLSDDTIYCPKCEHEFTPEIILDDVRDCERIRWDCPECGAKMQFVVYIGEVTFSAPTLIENDKSA